MESFDWVGGGWYDKPGDDRELVDDTSAMCWDKWLVAANCLSTSNSKYQQADLADLVGVSAWCGMVILFGCLFSRDSNAFGDWKGFDFGEDGNEAI